MITTAKRLGALLSACLLLWSASISALADEAVMSESEAPPEETQQEDAALSDRDFYLEDSEVAVYAAANQLAGVSKVHFYSLKSSVTTTIFGTLGGLPAKAMVTNSVYYPAYCLDKELLQWGDIDYSWTDLSFANQETVRQIIAQGFSETNGLSKSGWGDTHPNGGKIGNYEANTAKWAVTQLLVWAACKNYIVRNSATDWTWSSTVDTEMETVAKHAYNPTAFRTYYAELKDALLNGCKIPSFANADPQKAAAIQLKWNGSAYTATVTDSNHVLSHFDFSLSGVNFSRSGDKLTVTTQKKFTNGIVTDPASYSIGNSNAVAVWKCADSAIQRMATFTGGQTTVSAYLRLQTERINSGELIIQKTSEDGKKSGFTFKVTRDTDNWNATVKTDDNGTAKISELPVFRDGTSTPIQYTVTEINTPSSYRQPKPQTITLTSKGSVTVQFENTLIRGTLEICKVDADGKTPLAGAVFEIMDSDKNVIATETTGKDGKITVSDLRSGYYREISAPQGYELDSTVYPFTVEKDRQIIQITRKNTPSAGSVSVRKITPDGTALNDVSFLLQYSIDGGTAWSPVRTRKETDLISVGSCTSTGISDGVLTTGEDGKVTFSGLQVKNQNVTVLYRITEVRTKDGFQLLGEPLFEGSLPQDVNGTPQRDITITAVNGHQFELPAAGGNGMQAAIIGMIFAVIGLFGLLYVQKEKF